MKGAISFIFVSISILSLFLLETEKGWILLNGKDAESYAINLLKNPTIKTPEKFIDYSVSVSNGYVTFSKHNDHARIYVYFPLQASSGEGIKEPKSNWEALGENWFIINPN